MKKSKILREVKDVWYKKMSDKPTVKIEDEPLVGLMEWVDLMVLYNCRE